MWVAADSWARHRTRGVPTWVPDSWDGFGWVLLGPGAGGGRGTSLDHVATARILPRAKKCPDPRDFVQESAKMSTRCQKHNLK